MSVDVTGRWREDAGLADDRCQGRASNDGLAGGGFTVMGGVPASISTYCPVPEIPPGKKIKLYRLTWGSDRSPETKTSPPAQSRFLKFLAQHKLNSLVFDTVITVSSSCIAVMRVYKYYVEHL